MIINVFRDKILEILNKILDKILEILNKILDKIKDLYKKIKSLLLIIHNYLEDTAIGNRILDVIFVGIITTILGTYINSVLNEKSEELENKFKFNLESNLSKIAKIHTKISEIENNISNIQNERNGILTKTKEVLKQISNIQDKQVSLISDISNSQSSINETNKEISITHKEIAETHKEISKSLAGIHQEENKANQKRDLKIQSDKENTTILANAMKSIGIRLSFSDTIYSENIKPFLLSNLENTQKFISQKDTTKFLSYEDDPSFYYSSEGIIKDYYSLTFITEPNKTYIYLWVLPS